MSEGPFRELLDATVRHLEQFEREGMNFVAVDRATLKELTSGKPRIRTAGRKNPSTAVPAEQAKPSAVAPAIVGLHSSVPVVTPGSRTLDREAFEKLRERALICVKCPHLAASRKTVVFGVGDPESELMFIGEAPGADEDAKGEPFVGRAGQLLTRIIQTMGLSREKVYIANILKCRPDTPGQTSGNRKPTPQEMSTCIPFLEEQVRLIQPRTIVALGATAIEGLLGKAAAGIRRTRGQWQEYRGIPLMPTYHPAYVLRNQSLAVKREIWEDMLAVMERLGMQITERHKAYFLKPE